MLPIQSHTAISNAALGKKAAVLHCIHDSEINIATWQRSVSHLKNALEALLETGISIRSTGTPAEILKVLGSYFDHLGPLKAGLIQDISDLLKTFQAVTQANEFRVFMSTIESNMCKRFHTDINSLRMLCTYSGKGTLWAAEFRGEGNAALSRKEDGHVEPDPNCIQQAETGDVLILKGALYPNGEAVMHRSPSIEAEGGVRLMLRIDTNEKLFDLA